MEASAPARTKKPICQKDTSQGIDGVLSNLVAPSKEVIAVITKTTTIRGFETSIYDFMSTALDLQILFTYLGFILFVSQILNSYNIKINIYY
jgi:hypothetical protein